MRSGCGGRLDSHSVLLNLVLPDLDSLILSDLSAEAVPPRLLSKMFKRAWTGFKGAGHGFLSPAGGIGGGLHVAGETLAPEGDQARRQGVASTKVRFSAQAG